MAEFIQKADTYQIIGICMEVYNIPGYGFSEIVYKDAMEIEFMEKEILHIREHSIQLHTKAIFFNILFCRLYFI